MVQGINTGRYWADINIKYPIRKRKEVKTDFYCIDCGKKISKYATRCSDCQKKKQKLDAIKNKPVSKNELEQLIQTTTFTNIGRKYNVSSNAIAKWCKLYNLPYRKKDIRTSKQKNLKTKPQFNYNNKKIVCENINTHKKITFQTIQEAIDFILLISNTKNKQSIRSQIIRTIEKVRNQYFGYTFKLL